MKTILYSTLLLSIVVMYSCKEENIPYVEQDLGKEYYPAIVGKYITYKYDSVIYDDNGLTKYNLSGFIKEEVKEIIEENEEYKKYKIIKYWKQNDSAQWLLTDVEAITIYDNRVIKTEENLPFIKMIFPNNVDTKWDGNAMFDQSIIVTVYGEFIKPYEYWEYKVTSKGTSKNINSISFPETLDVQQVDDETSSLSKRYSIETYARNVGLIRREMKIYETQNPRPGEPWENYAQKGYSLVQEVIDYN